MPTYVNNSLRQECESNIPKCKLHIQIMTKTQDVKICTPKMEKICPEQPCETCPLFCQAHTQIWCEDDYKVCKAFSIYLYSKLDCTINTKNDLVRLLDLSLIHI